MDDLSSLGLLAPVGLDELEATAALLTRRDRKYMIPAPVALEVVARLADASRVLEIDARRGFRYESAYFDTPDGVSYLAAARRRPRRFKVRTRSYLDSGRCLLEVKTRDSRGRTAKERQEHPFDLREMLLGEDLEFAARCELIGGLSRALRPALTTRYTRSTLLVGAPAARVTMDQDLEARTPDGRLVALTGLVIIETKSPGPPSVADRVLWSLGCRPVKVSKFCTCLAALRPDLPSNRWTRALRAPWIYEAPGGDLLTAISA